MRKVRQRRLKSVNFGYLRCCTTIKMPKTIKKSSLGEEIQSVPEYQICILLMGQIIKSVCVCQSVCLSVCPCVATLTVAFICRFSPNLTQRCKPPKVRTSSLGVNIAAPLPLFYPQKLSFLVHRS